VFTIDDLASITSDVFESFDEPYFAGSAFPSYAVANLARNNDCKVVLAGDGGDEMFSGYRRYDLFAKQTRWTARNISRLLFRTLTARGYRDPLLFPLNRYFAYDWFLPQQELSTITSSGSGTRSRDQHLERLAKFYRSDLPKMTSLRYLDMHTFLVDEILSKVDRATMACGVEARVPLLDLDVVELSFRIDDRIVYRNSERKYILKRAVGSWLPQSVVSTRKKGFSIPHEAWIGPLLKGKEQTFLSDGALAQNNLIDSDKVPTFLAHQPYERVWTLIMAELWARRWLEGETRPLFAA
jgi:asparagine synthase (glutamine-hydrolysing)